MPNQDESLATIEREHIEKILARERSFPKAAAVLGIARVTLYRKRKRYALATRLEQKIGETDATF